MDERTAEMALAEIRRIEASLEHIQSDAREMLATADRIIAMMDPSLGQFASFRIEPIDGNSHPVAG